MDPTIALEQGRRSFVERVGFEPLVEPELELGQTDWKEELQTKELHHIDSDHTWAAEGEEVGETYRMLGEEVEPVPIGCLVGLGLVQVPIHCHPWLQQQE